MADPLAAQPGLNHPQQTQELQTQTAQALSRIQGTTVTPQQVQPPATQPAVAGSDLASEPHPEADWDDIMAGFTGKPRTDSSRNFLKVLINRFRKQNPGQDIVKKEK